MENDDDLVMNKLTAIIIEKICLYFKMESDELNEYKKI